MRNRIEALRTAGEITTLTPDLRLRIAASARRRDVAAVDRWPLHALKFSDIAKQLAASYRAVRRALPEDWASQPRDAA